MSIQPHKNKNNSKGKGKTNSNHHAPAKNRLNPRKDRRSKEQDELKQLQAKIASLDPSIPASSFSSLPLSSATKQGLKASEYKTPTPIQAASLPYSLKTRDVLGAARTGSGKTLAFLIAVLERLWREKWGKDDGLGALVIAPTRELALQIFSVLRDIGRFHSFSAGLVIGGKSIQEEQDRLGRMNVLVATPGRILQHLDQTSGFDTGGVKILVLDEADRLLDLGFSSTLSAILSHLPPSTTRQTLLFSATQTKRVKELANFSLRDAEYVAVGDTAEERVNRDDDEGEEEEGEGDPGPSSSRKERNEGKKSKSGVGIPIGLEQHYMTVELDKKLDVLWGFMKTHLKTKSLVFLSSCKQVRFVYETFRHLRPGVPLLHLHGHQKLSTRLSIYQRFESTTTPIFLFATDIASRGLDFPSVDWVIQVDCPEDVDSYVHRVGRTARGDGGKGKSLIMLTEKELEGGMRRRLDERGIWQSMKGIKIKDGKQTNSSIKNKVQSVLFKFPDVKFLAQRAFISYVRSIHLQRNKDVFKVEDLPLEEFADSLGLAGAPKIKLINKEQASKKKNQSRTVKALTTGSEGGEGGEGKDKTKETDEDESNNDDESSDALSSSSSEDSEVEEDEGEAANKVSEPDVGQSSTKTDGKTAREAPRTKYDRMFQRKNQSILSEHFNKIIDRDDDPSSGTKNGGGDDDFITLKRANHALEEETNGNNNDSLNESVELSKRKQKLARSKKAAAAKGGSQSHKIVFDEDGQAHELYELGQEEDFKKQGDARDLQDKFVKEERENLKLRDVEDRARAKEKRKEKKRKRKMMGDDDNNQGTNSAIIEMDEDDGYKSPEFKVNDEESDGDREDDHPSTKRRKVSSEEQQPSSQTKSKPTIADLEALALSRLKR